jgi:hypothetical protein
MKRSLVSAVILGLVLAVPPSLKAAPAQPDLIIQNVVIVDTVTAMVLVRNVGPAASGACVLRLEIRTPAGVGIAARMVPVPALAAGGGVWIRINSAPVPLRPGRMLIFGVDATGVVIESNEGNNLWVMFT